MKVITITKGMQNVLITPDTRIKLVCRECGLVIPKYRGKYPSVCPSCHSDALAVAESARDQYFSSLCETFLQQNLEIQLLHNFSHDNTRYDLHQQALFPFIASLREARLHPELLEVFYYSYFGSKKTPTKAVTRLIEAALAEKNPDPAWDFLLARAYSIYSPLVSEAMVPKVARQAKNLYTAAPKWLSLSSSVIAESRKRQLLSIAYTFARQFIEHTEALDYAQDIVLTEAIWVSHLPPSSVLNRRQKGDNRAVVGGFRFQTDNKTKKPGGKAREIQRRILSKKNKSAGIATTIKSARQMLQKRKALRKAQLWHRANPNAPKLHKGLGMLLHRSHGKYQSTNEGIRQLKRINASENALRVFTDGTPYHFGTIRGFTVGTTLLDSVIHQGSRYTLKDELRTISYHRGGASVLLAPGTMVEIISVTPAEEWGGDYPSPPMGQQVFEVKPDRGEFTDDLLEVDGAELALAVGIDEGTRLHKRVVAVNGRSGVVFLQTHDTGLSEVVVSAQDCLLSSRQLGSLLRQITLKHPLTEATRVRVYNDPSLEAVKEELQLSERLQGLRVRERAGSCCLILEADPEKKREIEQRTADELEQAKLQFQSDTEDAKSRVSDDQKNRLERLRAQHQAKKERIKQAKEKELSRLTTEDLSAGGPGGWLETVQQTRVVVDGTTGSQVRLMPGTQIRRQEGKIVVMSGPFTGREVTMTNEQFVPNFDLHLIHEHYRGLL
jgi:hypothetical protein